MNIGEYSMALRFVSDWSERGLGVIRAFAFEILRGYCADLMFTVKGSIG